MSTWIFDTIAPWYDRLELPWASMERDQIVATLDLQPGQSVLDVGGGTGALGRLIVERTAAQVTVLDASRAMLARLPRHPRLHALLGPANSLPFHAETFDWILCTTAFSWLSPQETCLAAMRRVLKPGGRLFLQDFDRNGLFGPLLERALPWLSEETHLLTHQEALHLLAAQGLQGQLVSFDLMKFGIVATKQL